MKLNSTDVIDVVYRGRVYTSKKELRRAVCESPEDAISNLDNVVAQPLVGWWSDIRECRRRAGLPQASIVPLFRSNRDPNP